MVMENIFPVEYNTHNSNYSGYQTLSKICTFWEHLIPKIIYIIPKDYSKS